MIDALISDLIGEARIDGAEAALVADYSGDWWTSMHSAVRSCALALMAFSV